MLSYKSGNSTEWDHSFFEEQPVDAITCLVLVYPLLTCEEGRKAKLRVGLHLNFTGPDVIVIICSLHPIRACLVSSSLFAAAPSIFRERQSILF